MRSVAALDRHDQLVAGRVTSPDADTAATEIRDEREAEGCPHRLRSCVRERLRMEEEAALVGALASLVHQAEPCDERDSGPPHLVERLGCPAGGEPDRSRMAARGLRVPAELRDPELNGMGRNDTVKLDRCLEQSPHLRQVA